MSRKSTIVNSLKKYGIFACLGIMAVSLTLSCIFFGNKKSNNEIIYSPKFDSDSEDEAESEYKDDSSFTETLQSSTQSDLETQKTEKTKKSSQKATKTPTQTPTQTQTQKIVHEETSTVPSTTKKENEVQFPLDINKVTKEELMLIDGVGEKIADKIISYRTKIGSIYDLELLKNIDGIGESMFQKLSKYLYVNEKNRREIPSAEMTTLETEPPKTEQSSEEITETETVYEITEPDEDTVRKKVNINKADVKEISDGLLIDIDTAAAIVELRSILGEFKAPEEIALSKKISPKIYAEIIDYIVV